MRLNIGCGPVIADGWVNVDRDEYPGAVQWDVEAEWLGREHAEGAVAHHVLQMVAWPNLVPVLQNVREALLPGAWFRLSVPDLELVTPMLARRHTPPPIADDHEPDVDGKVCLWVSQAGATRSVFTGSWLAELCHRAGFAAVWVSSFQTTRGPAWLAELDDRPDRSAESVYVDARR